MQSFIALLRFTATAFITMCISLPATAQPPLITSGMDAVVGRAGRYISNATIHTATFVDPQILAPGADILIEHEGLNEIPIPDGMGGTAMQIVNIDKTAPAVSSANPYVCCDGPTNLSVTLSDPVSGPASLDVSHDHGTTWQTHSVESGYSAPERVWSLKVDHGLFTASQPHTLARTVDVAGITSAVVTYAGAEK